jgi:solute carrier family 34 (sodium-dependent phosphate cotransporter)
VVHGARAAAGPTMDGRGTGGIVKSAGLPLLLLALAGNVTARYRFAPMLTEADRSGPFDRSLPTPLRVVLVLFLLYVFLVGIGLLEAGIAAAGRGFQEGLLREVSHPISGVCAGLLATVLVQSSSVSTATIVGMVGAGTLPVSLAVPMIMGANIGTTVTSTMASLGSIRRPAEFQRAFAAATVHDFFNIISVGILLPVELATGILSNTAEVLADLLRGAEFDASQPGTSPIRAAVKLPVGMLQEIVTPRPGTSLVFVGLGLLLIFVALALITRNMRRLVAGGVERAINRVIGKGGGAIGILVGIGITVAVQSSSITTSILVPLVAAGVLTLPNAYPITIGANIGTTITALIASLAVARPEGLVIALVHTLFNVTGMAVMFPLPQLRLLPVHLAEWIAGIAVRRRTIVLGYIVGLFIVLPLLGLFVIR